MAKNHKKIKGVTCKNGYWYARIDGKQKCCGKGDNGRKLAKAARMKWEVKQYENREVNAGLKVKKVELKSVIDLSNWYMEIPSIQEQASYCRKIYSCKHLLGYFTDRPLNRIESNEQEKYRRFRKREGAFEGTIDLEIRLLRAMYRKAVKAKMIPLDFLPGEFVLNEKTNPRRIVTEGEVNKLLKHANPDFRDLLICGYETAMRNGEICNLTAGQMHLDIKHISGAVLDYIDLGIFDTKTGARRNVPVSARLKEVLKRRLEGLNPDDYIFTEDGRKYDRYVVRNRMISTCNRAGVVYGDKPVNKKGERLGIVFHSLRHSRTSKWVEMGFSDEIIRRATGHKTLEAYQQYIKLDPYAVMRLVENPKQDKNEIKLVQSL
jgi:integrase